MLLYICYVIHVVEILFAVQTLEGIPFIALSCIYVVYYYKYNGRCQDPKGNCTRRKSPSGLIALLEIRKNLISSMEPLAHHEIGFNLVVFTILAFL